MGIRLHTHRLSGAVRAWDAGSRGAGVAQRMAGAALPLGRAVAAAGRWPYLGDELCRVEPGVAARQVQDG